jgi:hypothetical protein
MAAVARHGGSILAAVGALRGHLLTSEARGVEDDQERGAKLTRKP